MKTLLTASLFLVLFASTTAAEEPKADAEKQPPAQVCELEMKVSNMACPMGCPPQVEKALKGNDGVEIAKVSFDKGSATITAAKRYCEGNNADALVNAVKDAGFEGAIVTRKLK